MKIGSGYSPIRPSQSQQIRNSNTETHDARISAEEVLRKLTEEKHGQLTASLHNSAEDFPVLGKNLDLRA